MDANCKVYAFIIIITLFIPCSETIMILAESRKRLASFFLHTKSMALPKSPKIVPGLVLTWVKMRMDLDMASPFIIAQRTTLPYISYNI